MLALHAALAVKLLHKAIMHVLHKAQLLIQIKQQLVSLDLFFPMPALKLQISTTHSAADSNSLNHNKGKCKAILTGTMKRTTSKSEGYFNTEIFYHILKTMINLANPSSSCCPQNCWCYWRLQTLKGYNEGQQRGQDVI